MSGIEGIPESNAKTPRFETRPELCPIDVEREPERTWPPAPGILMIKRVSRRLNKDQFELQKVDLHFFTKVRKPGQEWESQYIAEVDSSGKTQPARQHSTLTEMETLRPVMENDRTKIEHFRATDEDLVQVFTRVLQYNAIYGARAETVFSRWAQEIYENPSLDINERPRIQKAFKTALTKA